MEWQLLGCGRENICKKCITTNRNGQQETRDVNATCILSIIFRETFSLLNYCFSLVLQNLFCNAHEAKSFLQLNLNVLFHKKVLNLSLGIFFLSIIMLLSSPVLQDPLSSLYKTYVLSYRNNKPLHKPKLNYHLNFSLTTAGYFGVLMIHQPE